MVTPKLAAEHVHAFLERLDPARLKETLVPSTEVAALRASLHVSDQGGLPDDETIDDAIKALQDAVEAWHGDVDRDGWLLRRDELMPLYEALVTALRRHGVRAQTLHPTNFRRTGFHVASGVAVVLAFERVFTPATAIMTAAIFCAISWSIEMARRFSDDINVLMMKVFKSIARDHERYRVNSSTWYGTALLLISLTCPNMAGMLGIMALAVGDPAAGFVGRKWGRIRIFRGKSLEGTLAFAAMSFLWGVGYLTLFHGARVTTGGMVAMAAAAAVTGAVVELISTRLDDNFTVPLASGWAALAVRSVLGF